MAIEHLSALGTTGMLFAGFLKDLARRVGRSARLSSPLLLWRAGDGDGLGPAWLGGRTRARRLSRVSAADGAALASEHW